MVKKLSVIGMCIPTDELKRAKTANSDSIIKMKLEDLKNIRLWVEIERKAIEFSVHDQTFQISGINPAKGLFERFFHEKSHPTRSDVDEQIMLTAIQKTTSPFELYSGPKGSGKLFEDLDAVLKAVESFFELQT